MIRDTCTTSGECDIITQFLVSKSHTPQRVTKKVILVLQVLQAFHIQISEPDGVPRAARDRFNPYRLTPTKGILLEFTDLLAIYDFETFYQLFIV